MKASIFILLLFMGDIATAQIVQYNKAVGGRLFESEGPLHISSKGNAFFSVYYNSDTLNSSSCTFNSQIMGLSYASVIVKYDSLGICLWNKFIQSTPGGTCNLSVGGIVTDSAENVYILGAFNGSIDMDPGPSVYSVSTIPSTLTITNYFLEKLDKNGNFVWGFSLNDTGEITDITMNLAIDKQQNLVMSGTLASPVDFDPGPSVFTVNTGTLVNTAAFLAKYSSSGTLNWAYSFKSAYPPGTNYNGGSLLIRGLTIDSQNNILITGTCLKTINFTLNGTTVDTLRNQNGGLFVAKYSTNALKNWAFTVDGGYGTQYGFYGKDIKTDFQNNVYVSGPFRNQNLDFDPSTNGIYPLNTNGYGDVFLAKYTAAGNIIFARKTGGINEDYFWGMDIDPLGNLYWLIQYNSPSADIDFTNGVNTVNMVGNDFIIMRTDSGGKPLLHFAISAPWSGLNLSIIKQFEGAIHIAGIYNGSPGWDIDPTNNVLLPVFYGGFDAVLIKYKTRLKMSNLNNTAVINEHNNILNLFSVFPNPAQEQLIILSKGSGDLFIKNSIGQNIHFEKVLNGELKIDVSELSEGVYFIVLREDNKIQTKKVVIMR